MIVIIGGGIAGLAAAFELARRDLPFLVLEASGRAGGLIVTERIDGFTIDGGPDSLLAQKPAGLELCVAAGLGPRLMPSCVPRTAFVLKRGRLHALPSPSVLGLPVTARGIAEYSLLSPAARLRIALEPLVPRRAPGDESVAAFFRRRFGRASVGLIAEPLLGGIHAGDVERLSMVSLFPRLAAAEHKPRKVLRTLARKSTASPEGPFRALRGGMAELTDTILSRLPPGSLRLNAPATSLRRGSASWQVAAGGETVDAAAVLLAAPAHEAARLLGPLDAAAAAICTRVPYASTASVVLAFRRDAIRHPLTGSGFVVARRYNTARITACTWTSSKWPHRAPEGYVLLRAFVGGTHDPRAVEASEDELVGCAIGDLTAVLGIAAPPALARVYRWPRAGAQHVVGHRAAMAALADRLRALPGLFVAGSGFSAIGIPDCVEHGRHAAAAAADYVRMEA